MKPITLDITGFGVFCDNVHIDFSKKSNGIFLISGTTGSGKTTIFDAIVFALYGRASGLKRESVNLRSDFLPDGVETEVKFTFSVNGNAYTVERTLNKKGEKMTNSAQLLRPDGTVNAITKQSDTENVNNEIERLLGLTAEQFTQICLLPQGEFEKILSSKGSKPGKDDREEILARLFDTTQIEKFQYLLERNVKLECAACEEHKTTFDANLKHLDYSGNEALAEAIKSYKTGTTRAVLRIHEKNGAKLLEALNDIIDYNENELSKLENRLKKLDGDYMNLHDLTRRDDEAAENQKKLASVKKQLEAIERRLEKEKYNDDDYFEQYKLLSEKINEEKEEVNILTGKSVKLSDYLKATDMCANDEKQIENALSEAAAAKEVAQSLYQRFIAAQGAKLAAQLKSGQPCPVCGSTEHPSPACCDDEIDEKQLKSAQQIEQKKAADLAAKKAVLAEHTNIRFNAMETIRQVFSTDFFDFEKAYKTLEEINEQIKVSDKLISEKQDELAFLERKHRELAEIIKEQKDLSASAKVLGEQIKDFDQQQAEKNKENLRKVTEESELTRKNAQILKRQVENNRRTFKLMSESLEKYSACYKIYDILDELDKLGKGQGKISFKRFVLGMFLDEILQRANEHFATMTDGRFMLVRDKNSGTTGLEVNVYDEYTGKERPSFTLSGGEKFKAALSMAFGMSETVQACSGGVKINTLLIDEGFGTLDSESSYLALEVLEGMSRSDLLIGIISHVDFLKNNVESQLEVVKNPNGNGSIVLTEKFS